MRFTRRVCGLENEFGVVIEKQDGTLVDVITHQYGAHINIRHIKNSVLGKDMHGRLRVWHSNGGSTYVDTGHHPEYDTPEVISARDAVCHNKAGERIVRIIFDRKNLDNSCFLLFKNNCGQNDVTGIYGCHENYSVRNCGTGTDKTPLIERLSVFMPTIPFFITRQIFDGSGWWNTKGNFDMSQRAPSIDRLFGNLSPSVEHTFMQLKWGDTGSNMRLHVVGGDANICEFAIYLKVGTTLLVLDLLESNTCPDIECIDPIGALKDLCRYADPTAPLFKMQNGSTITALDIQTMYYDAVRTQLRSADFDDEPLEHEINTTMLYWEQTLNAVTNRDDRWARGRIDHITKRYLADQFLFLKNPSEHDEKVRLQKYVDLIYHSISNPVLQQRMNTLWPDRRIVTDCEIQDAMITPPHNTRAAMRGKFVQTLADKGYTRIHTLDWHRLSLDEYERFDILSGEIPYEEGFEKFLAKIPLYEK